jgi:alpha-acetolactate decarboxylase
MAKVVTIKMAMRFELIMRTASGVELFYNSETNTFMSEDMDAVIEAIKRDMHSNNLMDVIMATGLFEKMQEATLISE